MKYVLSDPHGEYDLFAALLKEIGFSAGDTMYICGDMIDKGKKSVALLHFIQKYSNIRCILGNHEWELLKRAEAYRAGGLSDEEIARKLSETFFPGDEPFGVEDLSFIRSLPLYIEEEDFICVHAGAPIKDGKADPSSALPEQLVYDRRFKDSKLFFEGKCVFFGHTPTSYLYGRDGIVAYKKRSGQKATTIKDYCKIHLDTGCYLSHVLGAFRIDDLRAICISEDRVEQ